MRMDKEAEGKSAPTDPDLSGEHPKKGALFFLPMPIVGWPKKRNRGHRLDALVAGDVQKNDSAYLEVTTMPVSRYRCPKKNSTIGGMATMIETAMIKFQGFAPNWARNCAKPKGMVYLSLLFK